MDGLCLDLINSDVAIQQVVLDALLICCPVSLLTSVPCAGDGVSQHPSRDAYLPMCSPGHPPYPHDSPSVVYCDAKHVHAVGHRPPPQFPATVHVPIILDAFDVLNMSPCLGSAIVTSPDVLCRPSFERAVTEWVRIQAQRSGAVWCVFSPCVLDALVQCRTRFDISLLIVRVPHLLMRGTANAAGHGVLRRSSHNRPHPPSRVSTDLLSCPDAPGLPVLVGRSAASHPIRQTMSSVEDVVRPSAGSRPTLENVSGIPTMTDDASSVLLEARDCDSLDPVTQCTPCHPSTRPPSAEPHVCSRWPTADLPADVALTSGVSPYHCVVVVTVVFFPRRSAARALPVVKVRPLPTQPTSCHGLSEDLVVDLRRLPATSQLDLAQAVIVGCVWDLRGVVSTSLTPNRRAQGAKGGGAMGDDTEDDAASLRHYVTATHIQLPLCCLAKAVEDEKPSAGIGWHTRALSSAGLSDAYEERAAREGRVTWEGLRLALGTVRAPPPCRPGTLTTTTFFSLSLDAVVALFIALAAAHRPHDSAGISVVLFDGGARSFLSGVVRRLNEVSACAVRLLQPTSCAGSAGQWRGQALLPLYRTYAGPGQREDDSATPQTQSVLALMSGAAECITAGALSEASGCTLVIEALDGLPASFLPFLRESICARRQDDSTTGPSPFTLLQTDIQNNPSEAAYYATCQGGGGEVPPTTAERVIRRAGGQQVPYHTTHAFVASLRGSKMLSAPLFELLRRVDVVIRPAVSPPRKRMSLLSTTDAELQRTLQRGAVWWSRVVGDALNLLSTPPLQEGIMTPELSERCSSLLRLYFLVARVRQPAVVDSSLMETLTKLTCCHASLRLRVASQAQRREQEERNDQPSPSGSRTTENALTSLIDAVVAIGLCDSKLFFETQDAVLKSCVFQILETECMTGDARTEDGEGTDLLWCYLTNANSWSAANTSPCPFSIVRLANELEAYLCAQLPQQP